MSGSAILSIPVAQMELSIMSTQMLVLAGIATVGDLIECSEADILKLPKGNRKRLKEIKEAVTHLGLKLKGPPIVLTSLQPNGLVKEQNEPLANNMPAVWPMVIRDMTDRDAEGRRKYGVPLQPHNGRDVLVDAYQEALDLCVYLRQAIYERDGK